MIARPDLPAHHPQNVPLSQWTDGWLKLSCASHLGTLYVTMHEHEKRAAGYPVSRDDMIGYLFDRGQVPAAGL